MKADQKTVVVGGKSAEAMLAGWRALKPPTDPYARPPGAINAQEYATMHGITMPQSRAFLSKEAKAGRLITSEGRSRAGSSYGCFIWYQRAGSA